MPVLLLVARYRLARFYRHRHFYIICLLLMMILSIYFIKKSWLALLAGLLLLVMYLLIFFRNAYLSLFYVQANTQQKRFINTCLALDFQQISVTSLHENYHVPWNTLEKCLYITGFICLIPKNEPLIIIPASAFKGSRQFQSVVDFITGHIAAHYDATVDRYVQSRSQWQR